MPKISFHGLCGFVYRNEAGEVRVLMPTAEHSDHGGHQKADDAPVVPHRAFMLIDLTQVNPDPKKTTWKPDELVNSPDTQFGLWKLAGRKLSAGAGEEAPELPKGLISLRGLHELKDPATLNGGVEMSLKGGEMAAKHKYPVKLKLQNNSKEEEKKINREFEDYTEVVEWHSDELVISSESGSVTLDRGDVRVAITNAAPGFSPNHEGLKHFIGYYSTVKVDADDRISLIPEKPIIFTAGAGNCVPNVELP